MAVALNVVPHFIKARTPEQLVKKMLSTATRRGTHVPFFDIQRQDGNWYAWYNTEYKTNLIRTEHEDGLPKK